MHILRVGVHCTAQKSEFFIKDFFIVNVTKFAVSCGFCHITEEILNGKLDFFAVLVSKNKQTVK